MTRENLKALMGKSDVVSSQETKYQTRSYLESFVEWKAFPTEPQRKEYEEGDDVKGHWKVGGIIWIRKSVLKNFEDPEHVEIEEGYVHYVVLRPKRVVDVRYPVFTKACTLMNIYLHSDTKHDQKKADLLDKMADHRYPTKFLYAAGDTNVKMEPEDISSGRVSSPTVRGAYKRFLDKLGAKIGLRKIYQPYPTRVDGRAWSSIDRVFVAVPKDLQLEDFMDLTVSLPSHPHEPGKGREHPSDHYQLLLTPSPATINKKARFVIPPWLVRLPSFARRVKDRWAKIEAGTRGSRKMPDRKWRKTRKNPFRVLKLFDATMVSVAKAMMKERTGTNGDNVAALAVAMSQLRKLKARETPLTEAWNRCRAVPELKEALKDKGARGRARGAADLRK